MKRKTGLSCFDCDHSERKTDIKVTCELKKVERYAVFACICRDYRAKTIDGGSVRRKTLESVFWEE